eukprot:674817-Rhodomonas_salina.1
MRSTVGGILPSPPSPPPSPRASGACCVPLAHEYAKKLLVHTSRTRKKYQCSAAVGTDLLVLVAVVVLSRVPRAWCQSDDDEVRHLSAHAEIKCNSPWRGTNCTEIAVDLAVWREEGRERMTKEE